MPTVYAAFSLLVEAPVSKKWTVTDPPQGSHQQATYKPPTSLKGANGSVVIWGLILRIESLTVHGAFGFRAVLAGEDDVPDHQLPVPLPEADFGAAGHEQVSPRG